MFHCWYFTFRALPFVRDCQEYFYLNFTLFSACLIVFSTKFVQFEALLKIKKTRIIAWKNHDIRRCLLKCLIYEFHVWAADYRITSQLKMQRTQLRLESLVVLFISFFNRRYQKEPYYEPHNKEWIKENIYVMLRKQVGKWQHQKSRQSLHSWEFCTRLWSCFTDSLKIVFFQMQQFSFPFHSHATFNTDKHVKELLMERFGMVTGFCQTVSKVRITYCTK